MSLFGRSTDISEDLDTLLILAFEHHFSSQIQVLWNAGIILVVWLIWKSQNCSIFDNIKPNIHLALHTLWNIMRKTDSFSFGNVWNSIFENKLLQNLSLQPRHSREHRIIPVRWEPPPLKVNTDALCEGAPFGLWGNI